MGNFNSNAKSLYKTSTRNRGKNHSHRRTVRRAITKRTILCPDIPVSLTSEGLSSGSSSLSHRRIPVKDVLLTFTKLLERHVSNGTFSYIRCVHDVKHPTIFSGLVPGKVIPRKPPSGYFPGYLPQNYIKYYISGSNPELAIVTITAEEYTDSKFRKWNLQNALQYTPEGRIESERLALAHAQCQPQGKSLVYNEYINCWYCRNKMFQKCTCMQAEENMRRLSLGIPPYQRQNFETILNVLLELGGRTRQLSLATV
jgi:hypothetical protein